MTKTLLMLVVSLVAAVAVNAQDVQVDVKQHQRERNKTNVEERAQVQIPQQSRERVEQKTEVQAPERVRGNNRTSTQTRVEQHQNPVVEQTQTKTRVEQRVESRGGKFFFRNRPIQRRASIDRGDVHFSIGVHPRDWWYTHYTTIVNIEGCWYYEDGGFFYPAYGFDPECTYPDQYIVFELN